LNSMSASKVVGIGSEGRLESTANSTSPPIRVIRSHLYVIYLEERIEKSDMAGLSQVSVKQMMSKSKK